jgi:hypothetical protein
MAYTRADLDQSIATLRDLGVLTYFDASVTPELGWAGSETLLYRASQVFLDQAGAVEWDTGKFYGATETEAIDFAVKQNRAMVVTVQAERAAIAACQPQGVGGAACRARVIPVWWSYSPAHTLARANAIAIAVAGRLNTHIYVLRPCRFGFGEMIELFFAAHADCLLPDGELRTLIEGVVAPLSEHSWFEVGAPVWQDVPPQIYFDARVYDER